MERHAAGAPHARHCTFDLALNGLRINEPGKAAVLAVMVPDLAGMRAGRDQHRAVGKVGIVEQHADRKNVVIGVRIKRPVLMPFNRRSVMRRLHVELGAVQPQTGPNQFLENVEHGGGANNLLE